MSEKDKILLFVGCIRFVPLQTYEKDFTFVVNGKEFKTSRIISELLSPKICNMHSCDPTINTFMIKTYNKGDFSHILNLIRFDDDHEIPEDETPFISEVIEILGNDLIF